MVEWGKNQLVMHGYNEDETMRDMLNIIRRLKKSLDEEKNNGLINEAIEASKPSSDAIAITDDPRFGQNVLTNQIAQFRSIVESGAQFAKVDGNNVSECPLIYMPSTGNLVFSGVIPCLNNLKFQFVLKANTGNGCFCWADGLILNRENLQILQKLYAYWQNWRDSWNEESGDLERMAAHWNDV